ncbi:hypothetical protein BCO71033_07386 [Burkholderia contaminans]|uniref:Uncharacterized protein n=1 Tax=Burkholderia contaminans TaxID=488447 RepID=A0A6P3CA16_9BURK|nr:hypothetical protein BCO71033_07386 [Burkholderia contaminans]
MKSIKLGADKRFGVLRELLRLCGVVFWLLSRHVHKKIAAKVPCEYSRRQAKKSFNNSGLCICMSFSLRKEKYTISI